MGESYLVCQWAPCGSSGFTSCLCGFFCGKFQWIEIRRAERFFVSPYHKKELSQNQEIRLKVLQEHVQDGILVTQESSWQRDSWGILNSAWNSLKIKKSGREHYSEPA
jgi:hypothetical protein